MATPRRKPKPSESGSFLTVDNLAQLQADIRLLADSEVLVGFPEETSDRKASGGGKEPLTNAALGFIHDNGAPEANIPARPFMIPGIESARPAITKRLASAALSVLRNSQRVQPKTDIVEKNLHAVGMVAVAALKNKIDEGIPPPLADSTLQARLRRTPSRKAEAQELANRAAGVSPSIGLVKPLIDTGEMRSAINYALRSKKQREGA